jgi:NAD(P)-dependent dehydrogenase (short-subunit alcohol dehydrogenase family)
MSTEPFAGLHVVVTGGTGFLGSRVVELLLTAGATCHLPYFDQRELRHIEFADHARVHLVGPVDLADEAQVVDFFSRLPSLWASIHCAGSFGAGAFAEIGLDAYRRLMASNADAAFLCCREAVKVMRRSERHGRIVNVAARPALEPRQGKGMVAYTMAKAAVAALTVALGEELASEGIWVNAIAPSIIDTPANRQAMPAADPSSWPKPEELAATIVHLASPENHSVRSGLIPVYGRL